MFKSLSRSLLVAGAVAAMSLGLGAAQASAGQVQATVTTGPSAGIVLAQYHERGDRYDRHDRRDDRGGRYERSSCSAGQALRKASRFGLRRPEVVRDNRRAVVVDGWKRGRLVSVRFAQERGCPVLNVR